MDIYILGGSDITDTELFHCYIILSYISYLDTFLASVLIRALIDPLWSDQPWINWQLDKFHRKYSASLGNNKPKIS